MGVGGNALFALVACAGFAWQYAWIFLLLDVLLISDDLQNLLKAVILPWRQLALALYSLLVFTAILSVVNFYLNAADDDGAVGGVHQLHAPAGVDDDDYGAGRAPAWMPRRPTSTGARAEGGARPDRRSRRRGRGRAFEARRGRPEPASGNRAGQETVCASPWTCLLRDVYVGLVDGQMFTATLGMDHFDGPSPGRDTRRAEPDRRCGGARTSAVLVQLTFFILVTLLLINVFTGIILDTFSSLREELSGRKEKEKYECFVCGVDRTTLDDFGIDKEDHETHEHNKPPSRGSGRRRRGRPRLPAALAARRAGARPATARLAPVADALKRREARASIIEFVSVSARRSEWWAEW
ncbi:inositol 1,4,5-trisphosphate-sensitive calcium-release channel [Aureococcus anophagefferens]|nr:inositol 1,4,5-trisphosphate-sensitive calcium-release channel [Aureococcus anophagefferens]